MLPLDLSYNAFIELIDNAYDEICVWNREMRLVYINKPAQKHYGYTPEECVGQRVGDLVEKQQLWSPTIVEYTFARKKPLMQKQRTISGIDIMTISTPIFDAQGEVAYVVQNVRELDEFLFRELEPVTADSLQQEQGGEGEIIARSAHMRRLLQKVRKLAKTEAPLLITGETGVGKTQLARQIHEWSGRKEKPFVSVNMSSLSGSVLETELFGYEAGTFTGEKKEGKRGLLEVANGGTLFLDEIGDFPLDLQTKFLQVLQDEAFVPVGGSHPVPLDVRILYATNIDLPRLVEAGSFRRDLYERINMMEVRIPALRERPDDLTALTEYFLEHFNHKYRRQVTLPEEVGELFSHYQWQGNVRELSNAVERLVLLSEDGVGHTRDLPESFFSVDFFAAGRSVPSYAGKRSYRSVIEEAERQLVEEQYDAHPSSRKLATALGVSQSTASRLIRKYIPEGEADG